MIQYLKSHLETLTGQIQYSESLHYKHKVKAIREKEFRHAILEEVAPPPPTYVFLMTEPYSMPLFLSALVP
jgi:hypothetical protein